MVQKHSSIITLTDDPSIFVNIEKTTERVIRDKGKEKPKKNVFKVSFSMVTNLKYSLFRITRVAMISPVERHNNEAW